MSNSSDAKREQFQVGWSDGKEFVGKPQDIYVPPGQSRVVALNAPPLGAIAERVLLRGDEEAFDNSLALIPPEAARVSVLYLGGEAATDTAEPLYFLSAPSRPRAGKSSKSSHARRPPSSSPPMPRPRSSSSPTPCPTNAPRPSAAC